MLCSIPSSIIAVLSTNKLAITGVSQMSFELCMLIVISYYHDTVMLTITIMITIDCHDNQLTTTIAHLQMTWF